MKYIMITKFKIFESVGIPKVGDYVIVDASHCESIFEDAPIFLNFLKTIIGQVVDYKNSQYKIKYNKKDIPTLRFKYFFDDDYILVALVDREDIKYHSNNKEDLVAILNSNKYNL